MGFLCGSYAIPCYFYDLSIGFLCDSYGFPWYFYDISLGLLLDFWDVDGLSMGFLWDFHWIPMGFLWYLLDSCGIFKVFEN